MVMPSFLETKQAIYILYKNWQGEVAWRYIIPVVIEFTTSPHHPEAQWLLRSWDLDKQDWRSFALLDIQESSKECPKEERIMEARYGKQRKES